MQRCTASKGIKKACVIGAGPSGLYMARQLVNNNVDVEIVENTTRLLGNYKFAKDADNNRAFDSIISHPRIKFLLCRDYKQLEDIYDFYICATGGKPRKLDIKGSQYIMTGMDLIQEAFERDSKKRKELPTIGEKVCIIGMGNVSMDLVDILKEKYNRIREIMVLSRSKLENAAFDNHRLRDVIEKGNYEVKVYDNFDSINKDRRVQRRYQMVEQYKKSSNSVLKRIKDGLEAFKRWIIGGCYYNINSKEMNIPRTVLKLVFNAKPESAYKEKDKIVLKYTHKSIPKKKIFDSVISCIGFVPKKIDLQTEKPTFNIGWCADTSKGRLEDTLRSSEVLCEELKSKNII